MAVITRQQARLNRIALMELASGPERRELGGRKLRHTAIDAAVYHALVSHVHWPTGRCFPGYRAIRQLCGAALSTISASIKRLRDSGWIKLRRTPVRVPGHGMRWSHAYWLVPVPRSEFGTQPSKARISNQIPRARAEPEEAQEVVLWDGTTPPPPISAAERAAMAQRWGL